MTLPLSTITYYYVNIQSIALCDSRSGKFALTWIFEGIQFLIRRSSKQIPGSAIDQMAVNRSQLSLSLSLSLPLSWRKKWKDSHFLLTSTFFKTRCSNKVKPLQCPSYFHPKRQSSFSRAATERDVGKTPFVLSKTLLAHGSLGNNRRNHNGNSPTPYSEIYGANDARPLSANCNTVVEREWRRNSLAKWLAFANNVVDYNSRTARYSHPPCERKRCDLPVKSHADVYEILESN